MERIHIYAPASTAKRIEAGDCPDCERRKRRPRSRFLAFFTPWYGWRSTCLRCGREWADGEWMPLEFCRGVREINIQAAKKLWREMPPVSANHWGLEGLE